MGRNYGGRISQREIYEVTSEFRLVVPRLNWAPGSQAQRFVNQSVSSLRSAAYWIASSSVMEKGDVNFCWPSLGVREFAIHLITTNIPRPTHNPAARGTRDLSGGTKTRQKALQGDHAGYNRDTNAKLE